MVDGRARGKRLDERSKCARQVAAEMATHSGGFEDGEMDKEVINLPSRWAK